MPRITIASFFWIASLVYRCSSVHALQQLPTRARIATPSSYGSTRDSCGFGTVRFRRFSTRRFFELHGNDGDDVVGATEVHAAGAGEPFEAASEQTGPELTTMADRRVGQPKGVPLRKSSGDTLTIPKESPNVGKPQEKQEEKSYSTETILKELQAIQNTGPRKYVILGTRHGSFMHQQIIELLSYALVLTGNHIFTSGAPGTNAAAIRGALRAERQDLLTVVLPQSLSKQPEETQELLAKVEDVIDCPFNDVMSLDLASRLCNSDLLSRADALIAFAFHDSFTVIEATKEAKSLDKQVTVLYLD